MKKEKKYSRVWFDVRSIEKIVSEFQDIVQAPGKTEFRILSVTRGNENWEYDAFEELLAGLREGADSALLFIKNPDLELTISNDSPSAYSYTRVEIHSGSRERIIRLSNMVDTCAEDCFVPPPPQPEAVPPKPKIFIGHGGSQQWRDLKDHLQDQHGYEIISYETGSRAGHAIRDIIVELLGKSSFAILVMTGEDDMADGTIRARQNVIHEIGLFQGRLGFTKAIVLKEDGTEEFSNIHGVHQIRYSRGNIKETFGDVLATLNKEFGKRR